MNRMWLTELHFLTRAVLLLAAVATGICQAASITLSGRVMDKDGAAIAVHLLSFARAAPRY